MGPTIHSAKQTGRSRVMIVDSEWQFGLKLADCLATRGYHAVLVRDLESTLGQLGEIQPEAILLRQDSDGAERNRAGVDALRAINAVCPQAPVLTLTQPLHHPWTELPQSIGSHEAGSVPPPQHPVEGVLLATFGIPWKRVQ